MTPDPTLTPEERDAICICVKEWSGTPRHALGCDLHAAAVERILAARAQAAPLTAEAQVALLSVPTEEAMQHFLDGLNVSGLTCEVPCLSGRAFIVGLTDPDADHVHYTFNDESGRVHCCECEHPGERAREFDDCRWEPTYPVLAMVSEWPTPERVAENGYIDPWWTREATVAHQAEVIARAQAGAASTEDEPTLRELFAYRNELGQTFRELLVERIRTQGGRYLADHPEKRGNDRPSGHDTFLDGIMLDLDEPDEVEYLVLGVTAVIREIVGERRYWTAATAGYFDEVLSDPTAATRADTPAEVLKRVRALLSCVCNTSPSTDGPEQDCPEHGDQHAAYFATRLRAALRGDEGDPQEQPGPLERVQALADQWERAALGGLSKVNLAEKVDQLRAALGDRP